MLMFYGLIHKILIQKNMDGQRIIFVVYYQNSVQIKYYYFKTILTKKLKKNMADAIQRFNIDSNFKSQEKFLDESRILNETTNKINFKIKNSNPKKCVIFWFILHLTSFKPFISFSTEHMDVGSLMDESVIEDCFTNFYFNGENFFDSKQDKGFIITYDSYFNLNCYWMFYLMNSIALIKFQKLRLMPTS